MGSNNKNIKELRAGVVRLAGWLDNNYYWISRNDFVSSEEEGEAMHSYDMVLNTIEMLGGDWQRDENGKHKVFIAGVGGRAESDNEN